MSEFLYETHMHTSEASACATESAERMVRVYAAHGYSGMIMTDHFFNGNTAIPAWLPWEDRVGMFCRAYEKSLKAGNEIGFSVFFGWEYSFFGTDFLTYGLDGEFLLDHPDILKWPLKVYLNEIRANGGFISHAHPFRKGAYIREVRLYPEYVDAVEVVNTSHTDPSWNAQAMAYAEEHGLLMTSGSDAHDERMILGAGMLFDHRLSSINDFINSIRSKKGCRLSA